MNILYTLSGFGFGHATRSQVVIKRLKSLGHSVKIATYGQSLYYLKDFFPDDLIQIGGFKNQFFCGKVSTAKMVVELFRGMPTIFSKNIPILKKIIKNFKIDVVFNDFEPSARWLSRLMDVPIVTIDNQSLSQLCRVKVPLKFQKDFLKINTLINLFYPWGDWRFILSFSPFDTPVKKHFSPSSFIVPPILREEIFKLKISQEDFILVYQTAPVYKKKLINVLENIEGEKFVCYNLEKGSIAKNIFFKDFSEKEFLNDLSRAKAVITNGGFTIMAEAMYLKKPIFSLPIRGDFEQILNGLILQKSGCGLFCENIKKFNKETLSKFLNDSDFYKNNLQKYKQDKNEIFEKKLLRVLRKIESGGYFK